MADIVDVKRFVAIEKRQCVSTGVFTPLHCTIDVREFVDKPQICRLNYSFEAKIIDNNKNIDARKYSTTFTAPILLVKSIALRSPERSSVKSGYCTPESRVL